MPTNDEQERYWAEKRREEAERPHPWSYTAWLRVVPIAVVMGIAAYLKAGYHLPFF